MKHLISSLLILSTVIIGCSKSTKSLTGEIPFPVTDLEENRPANGYLDGSEFQPIIAAITRSENSGDQNNYYWVRMTDIPNTDPCEIVMTDRFVGFYISQTQPVDTFDMSVRRGATHGAIFFSSSGGYQVNWVREGWVNVTSFDKINGADLVMDIGSGANKITGKIKAVYCN